MLFWHTFFRVHRGRQMKQMYRVSCILALITGASIAALIYDKQYFGLGACLLAAIVVKVFLAIAVSAWPGYDQEEEEVISEDSSHDDRVLA